MRPLTQELIPLALSAALHGILMPWVLARAWPDSQHISPPPAAPDTIESDPVSISIDPVGAAPLEPQTKPRPTEPRRPLPAPSTPPKEAPTPRTPTLPDRASALDPEKNQATSTKATSEAPPTPKENPQEETQKKQEEEKKEEKEEPSEDPLEGGQSGDALAQVQQDWLRYVRGDDEDTKVSDPRGAFLSDRNTWVMEQTLASTSTQRAIGDGLGESEEIHPVVDNKGQSEDENTGLKKGVHARRSMGGATEQPPQPVPVARTSPELVQIPVLESTAPSGEPQAGAGVAILVEKVIVVQKATFWAPRIEVQRPLPVAPMPVPVVDVTAQAGPTQRGGDDGFWGEAGEEVPDLLADLDADAPAPKPTAAWSSYEVMHGDLPEDDVTRVSLRSDEMGVWMGSVDDVLREQWVYPPELRALGVTGKVTLEFTVMPDGSVTRKSVVAGNEIPDLVIAAMASLPESVPPIPDRKVWRKGITIRYTFYYGDVQG